MKHNEKAIASPRRTRKAQATDLIVELKNVEVRAGATVILSDLNWTLRRGESWAVLGPNAAGKSTFLRLIRGDVWPVPGRGTRTYYVNGIARTSPICFRGSTGFVSTELLDRYARMEWNVTCLEAVCSGFWGTVYAHRKPSVAQIDRAREVMDLLEVNHLSQRNILTLSQGEAKKILIARALVHNPSLLILDEVCEALDQSSRESLLQAIQRIAESGTQVLASTHETEDLVPALKHVVRLDSGRIVARTAHLAPNPAASAGTVIQSSAVPLRTPEFARPKTNKAFLIRITEADVFLRGKRILHRINWTLNGGEQWAVLGANGSGKTTLLRLLMGDVYPRFGGTVHRFGDDNPHSIREIRERVSLVSADLQASHVSSQTGLDTVLSGFFGSIGLHDTPTSRQVHIATRWLTRLGIDSLAQRDIGTLSYGQLRMLMIARAMVNEPLILLLDEPLSGLDSAARLSVMSLIEACAAMETSMVYVTHRAELIPECITHVAGMRSGRLRVLGLRHRIGTDV